MKKETAQPMGYLDLRERKASGAHYTPRRLAQFVARSIAASLSEYQQSSPKVLDPATGDAELLLALIEHCKDEGLELPERVDGYDIDPQSIKVAKSRLETFSPSSDVNLKCGNFLEYILTLDEDSLFEADLDEQYDAIITNPPYVRTQVMGSEQAQILSEQFGLSGRVDLYFAFIQGIARVLRPGGIAGIIVSNRFMTTKSGASIRRSILERFNTLHVWDLGDTRLFEAAVLPAVLLLQKKDKQLAAPTPRFSSIYSTTDERTDESKYTDVFEALKSSGGVIELESGDRFRVQHGTLNHGDSLNGVWRIANDEVEEWLSQVTDHKYCHFGDIGKVRVGVKTTADKVFIRKDWDTLGEDDRPELLRPLITHHIARKFRAIDSDQQREILYTHTIENGKRCAVDLNNYPRSKQYLEHHRERLESRKYVIDSGRNWFEIWVPHNPSAWGKPKLVFRDIAEEPTFWIDLSGAVVNGDCYWLINETTEDEFLLWLALAIGNSSFIKKYYDHAFNNKLYAHRRRFMTQYVEKFPVPDPDREVSQRIVQLAKEIYEAIPDHDTAQMQDKLDKLVWSAFGFSIEEIGW